MLLKIMLLSKGCARGNICVNFFFLQETILGKLTSRPLADGEKGMSVWISMLVLNDCVVIFGIEVHKCIH